MTNMIAFGSRHRLIEPHDYLARRNAIAILHENRTNDARFQRLDRLSSPCRHNLAGRRGDDVNTPQN